MRGLSTGDMLAIGWVAVFFALAVFGPVLSPFDPRAIDLDAEYQLPNATHWLGTGDNGIDILSMLLHGARLSGMVCVGVIGVSLLFGALLGVSAGYLGGKADHAITGLADVVQAFPGIVLQIAILAVVTERHVGHLIFALSVSGWVLYARLARARALSLREREFVWAARALGASRARIIVRHLLPNLVGPLIVQASIGLPATILAETTLAFLGIGPSAASWGTLLYQGTGVLLRFPHVALFAGVPIALSVLAFNIAGDRLRDRMELVA